jgi:hypothetical protein
MQAPLTLAAVAVNGCVLVIRYTWSESHEGFDGEVLAEPPEGKGLALPINIMIVDSGGEAARVLVEQGGIEYLH